MTPYKRVQLLSGGGSRFGYYLGSYAMLCERGQQPDLLLATCGGALASLLIDIAPDPKALQALISSHELYQVICASQARRHVLKNQSNHKPRYFYHALQRYFLTKQAHKLAQLQLTESHDELLNELTELAMFEIINETDGEIDLETNKESQWLDELVKLKTSTTSTNSTYQNHTAPDIAIIASRLLPTATANPDLQTENQQPVSLQEVLFAPQKLTAFTKENTHQNQAKLQLPLQCPTHVYAPQRIVADIHLVNDWDIKQAVRASMADMYYLKPCHIEGLGWCLGGVIDLTPIELACQLGKHIFAERKARYDNYLASPAIKRVFGFDPNDRLQAVHDYQLSKSNATKSNQHIHWLDFADNSKVLAGQHVRKKFNIKAGRIDLIHASFSDFVKQIQAQWQYGYQRTGQYLDTIERINQL